MVCVDMLLFTTVVFFISSLMIRNCLASSGVGFASKLFPLALGEEEPDFALAWNDGSGERDFLRGDMEVELSGGGEFLRGDSSWRVGEVWRKGDILGGDL